MEAEIEPASSKRTCLLVLGMHRSGTSALTRILNILGAALPINLLGGGVGNETGHWEPERLVNLHDQMLAEAGSSWNDWRKLDLETQLPEGRLDHYKAEIRRQIEEEYRDAPMFVLKDPRICRFVPLYRDVLRDINIAVRPILTFRNPLSVDKSLKARNEMPSAPTLLYWLRHVLDAEAATRDLPRSIISYENLLANWRETIEPISAQLGIGWLRAPAAAAVEIDGFLSPDYQHHISVPEELRDSRTVPQWVLRTYTAMLRLDTERFISQAELAEVSNVFDTACSAFSPALMESTNQFHAAVEALRHSMARETDDKLYLQKKLNSAEIQLEQLESYLSETTEKLDRATGERVAVQQELTTAITEHEEKSNDYTKQLRQFDMQIIDLQRKLRQLGLQNAVATCTLRSQSMRRTWFDKIARAVMPTPIHVHELYAANDIEGNGLPHGWRCTGNDPQFLVPLATDARFIRVRFRALVLGVDHNFRGRWQLFYSDGSGFREADSHIFEFAGSKIEIDQILPLKTTATAFRLDPADRACELIIENFEIAALSSTTTRLAFAYERACKFLARDSLPTQMKKIAAEVRRGHTVSLLQRLFEPERIPPERYQSWVERRLVTAEMARQFAKKASAFDTQPVFSIIMPTYNSPPEYLRIAIDSVRRQTYGNWELIITDDGSTKKAHIPLLKEISAVDDRIKVYLAERNGGISAASNNALGRAKGEYIVLFDHDDELQPHALHAFAAAINDNPDADWLYSDEDKISEAGQRFGAYFKPDWSPAFFLSCMYTCHLGVYRRRMVNELGGFRSEFDLAQDYDLALRFASSTTKIVHIPDVLYHWRTLPQSTASSSSAKPIAETRARNAVQSFINRGKYRGKAVAGELPGTHRVKFELLGEPLVSIAIPSAGRRSHVEGRDSWLVLDLVKSIRARSTYRNIEIVIAENGDFDPLLKQALEPLDIKLVTYDAKTFNIADKMNLVVGATVGEYVIILNDDMEIITLDWIEEMLMWAQQDDVCGVGARLLFPDRRIQHAGVLLLEQGPSHVHYLDPRSTPGLAGNAQAVHECLAVTGACMMIRKADYLAVGGFDPAFRINYNDVDFCLKLIEHTGGRILYTPFAELYHYESVSRETAPPIELSMFNEKWKKYVGSDPYYSRHLSQSSSCYELSSSAAPLHVDYHLSD